MSTQKIVLATSNPGKVREFNRLLEGSNIEILLQSEFNVVSPEETGTTFFENALIKAKTVSLALNENVLADDSGLAVVDDLGTQFLQADVNQRLAQFLADFVQRSQIFHITASAGIRDNGSHGAAADGFLGFGKAFVVNFFYVRYDFSDFCSHYSILLS